MRDHLLQDTGAGVAMEPVTWTGFWIIFVICALTMLVCFVITFLLRMVPVVRDYL